MRVGYFQFDVVWGDPDRNVAIIESAVGGADTDLIVLPELCTTGYLFDSVEALNGLAEPLDGPVVTRFSELAVDNASTIVFGIAERAGNELFNTAVVVSPDGSMGAQRKRHLARLEKHLFSVGGTAVVHQTPAATLGSVMCFDAWFPERSRILTELGAEVLCCPSNFGGPDSLDVFRVRALENRVFVIVANRVGSERLGPVQADFRGDSRVIGPDGTVLSSGGNEEALNIIDIDLSEARLKASIMSDDLKAEWSHYRIIEG
jgi:predicted amidohydrolase